LWDERREIIELVRDLGEEVRSAVRPLLGSEAAKGIAGHGATGDTTFCIDEVAEKKIEEFLGDHLNIAYYTEDAGLVVPEKPEFLLVIDPIDGTRPAAAGLECCCVSVAVSEFKPGRLGSLTLADVFFAFLTEIKNRATYTGLKGHGARIEIDGKEHRPRLSGKTDLSSMFWTSGFRGRPAEPLVTVLGELIDTSSVDGGYFDLGSATFDITRVILGEMDAYVDVGQRMVDVEAVKEMFLEVGHGAILNNYPYDLAAAALIASESGVVVSDAYGESLDPFPLVPPEGEGQMSSIVSANPVLHGKILAQVESGMERLAVKFGG